MEDFFNELSEKENGKFQFTDTVVNAGMGTRTPHLVYYLNFSYKEREIIIKNEVTTAAIGNVFCKIQDIGYFPEFSIETKSNFFRLFSRNKSSFKIECDNINQKFFLINNESLKRLDTLARNSQFEPLIYIDKKNKSFNLITEYNLLHVNRQEVIIELIQFYKDLIDRI